MICSFFNFSTTVASYGATKFSNILEAQVVFTPVWQRLSFKPIGIPANLLFLEFASISFASCKADSQVFVIKACTSFSFSFILSE